MLNLKKLFFVVLAIISFSLMFSLVAGANSGTYKLHDGFLEVTIPSEYTVITEDTPEDSDIFVTLGVSKSEFMKIYEKNNIGLVAIPEDYGSEIRISISNTTNDDLNNLTDSQINGYAAVMAESLKAFNLKLKNYEVYQNDAQLKFVKTHSTFDTPRNGECTQYTTCYGGKDVIFTAKSCNDSVITASIDSDLKDIVDSVKFEKKSYNDTPENEKSFVYTDADTGVSFTVPENWKEQDDKQNTKNIDAVFEAEGNKIAYSSVDVWLTIPDSEKIGINRTDINNSGFSKEDIADMYSTTADKISVVQFNNTEFFLGEATYTKDDEGTQIPVTTTQAVRYDNGWMYMFQFSGTKDSYNYNDFEELLNSIEFKNSTMNTPINNNYLGLNLDLNDSINSPSYNFSSVEDTNEPKLSNGVIIAIDFLITIIVYMFYPITIIIRKKKYTKKELRKITLFNAFAGFLIFTVINFVFGVEHVANMAAAFIWSSIAEMILRKTSLKQEPEQILNNMR